MGAAKLVAPYHHHVDLHDGFFMYGNGVMVGRFLG